VTGRVLVDDDDADMCRLVEAALVAKGFEVVWRTSAADAFAVVDTTELDAVVTDLELPETSGLALCERIVANRPDLPVTVLTAFGSFDTAIAAIRAGAYDFITKPPQLDVLAHAVARAVEHRALRGEVRRLRDVVSEARTCGPLLTAGPAMRQVLDLIARVADTDATILVVGESGTGKELVARALHDHGRRAAGPFVAVNCAAMPDALLESELFGHVRGAFTDARTARPGLFAQAEGGTLFLDEIGELPLSLQPKLLRALQERTIRPVGGDAEIPFDARIVAATHHDLDAAVAARRFRQDLHFRLDVVRIAVPPLRARGNDVLLLAQHFVERYAAATGKPVVALSPAAAKRLLHYSWPGNVRELQNAIERAVALARFDRVAVDDLPEKVQQARPTASAPVDPNDLAPLAEVERRHVLRVLARVGDNRKRAAEILGVDRKTLYRKLLAYRASS
jgi:two-component system response regulator HydG